MTTYLPMPGNEALAASLARFTGGNLGRIETRRFPDGETYLRILSDMAGEPACIVCTLARPDEKLLPLLFAAATARRLGSPWVRLVAPYLAYMRQDAIFQPGEALSSRDFASILGSAFDELITVDPHLHRYASLSEAYACATKVVHAAPAIGRWIAGHVGKPLIVGPDAESEQWAAEIAAAAGAPHIVLSKQRLGDHEVRLLLPDLAGWEGYRPVLVDDIVSSGATIASAAQALDAAGMPPASCAAVHALFDDATRHGLLQQVGDLVSTDTVPGPTSRIEIAELIAAAL